MAGNIGMMNEAYFLSKAVLLEWVNNFLQLNLEKVEQMATGACYCNLFDALHPQTIPMNRVDFSVKYDYEYSKNWKLLQNAFGKVGIKKIIPVERLTKARYQDNLEFLQWFYKYAHDSYPGDCDNPDYDAIHARSRSKGGKEFTGFKNSSMANKRNRNKENMIGNARPPSARGGSRYNNNNNSGIGGNNNNNNSNSSMGSMRGMRGNNNSGGGSNVNSIMNSRRGSNNSMGGGSMGGNNNNNGNNEDFINELRLASQREIEQLKEENKKIVANGETLKTQFDALNNEHSELRSVAKDIEKERDFYFNKVLQVETICKQHSDQSLQLLKDIYNILYQTDESAEAIDNGTGNDNENNNNDNKMIDDGNNNVDNNMNDNNFMNNNGNGESGMQMDSKYGTDEMANDQSQGMVSADINMNPM